MIQKLITSPTLWIVLSFGIYLFIAWVQSKIKSELLKPFVNPLLLTIVGIIVLLVVSGVSYEQYKIGGQYIGIFVTPATVALAIKLEKNFDYLRGHYQAILSGIIGGVIVHTILIFAFGLVFGFDSAMVATLFPKSITTAIAVGVSGSLGGIVPLTVALVVFTGVVGGVIGEPVLKMFGIKNPVAQGVALGMSSHAMGTSKAIEMGEVQGAMSGLSIVITGIVTVILSPFMQSFIQAFN